MEQWKEVYTAVSTILYPAPVYLVGGALRDALLGQTSPKDYDFTTPLAPDEIEQRARAAGRKVYIIGKKFGTIVVKVPTTSGFVLVDVTTFRSECYSVDSHKPDVQFVDNITQDLSRRDFTVNAIAYRTDQALVDPFNGQDDIKGKIIRAIGNPTIRFKEDPLRMLRAIRLACQLGFSIDPETLKSIHKNKHLIYRIAKERWVMELDKILVSADPAGGFRLLAETELLRYVLPELWLQVGYDQNSPHHAFTLFEHSLRALTLASQHGGLSLNFMWGVLLHDIGKPFVRKLNKRGYCNYVLHEVVGAELVLKIGVYLKWPKSRTEDVSHIVRNHLTMSEFRPFDDGGKQEVGHAQE